MYKNFTKILLLLLIFIPGIMYSQSTLIYFEDFENTDTSRVHLNSGEVGSNNGINQWEINMQYIGQPIFPNTISEDSTYGGLLITHPDSNYLHIHDVNVNSVSNDNFDPNIPGDRFTTLGPFCTLGQSTIHFAFSYLCIADTTEGAYGLLYYKTDSAGWTLASPTEYANTPKWKYADITDPAYENQQNLYFGFRWVNGTGTDTTTSFGIDDIKIVGTYDPVKYPVKIIINQVFGAPVCQGQDVELEFTLSAPLCGQGIYEVKISGPGGNFSQSTSAGDFLINNQGSPFLDILIPANATADSCYELTVTRTDVTPNIVSDTSLCFQVMQCPNTLTILQPVMLTVPTDTICVGSVIDVPFLSTGVFVNNRYIAQLSDSNGNFTTPINALGTFVSSQTYSGPPGTVSGKIVPSSQPIPPGCKYFIRVISTSPADTGSLYGPFCIRDCNIETNNTNDINLCIPPGVDNCFPVRLNQYADSLIYAAGNHLKVEVHSSMTYDTINTGGLATLLANKDTCLQIDFPNLAYLNTLGMGEGLYYIRIIADSSSQPWNVSGTLIRLIIGESNPTPLNVFYWDQTTFDMYPLPDTAVCTGTVLYYIIDPAEYNPSSTYAWTLNNQPWTAFNDGFEDYTGIIFNGAGDIKISVVETNYGCVGLGSDTVQINVLGPPSVSITGPTPVCVGDTEQYSVPLENQTYYSWSSPAGTILDTSNNDLTIAFYISGDKTISIQATGQCGVANSTKNINVKPYPYVYVTPKDTIVCRHDSVDLSTPSSTYSYKWIVEGDTTNIIGTNNSIIVTPDTATTYIVTATIIGAGCSSTDTATVFIDTSCSLPVVSLEFDNTVSLYPNPATKQLIIHFSALQNNEAVTVSIMNLLGQEASPPVPLQKRGENALIDVSELAAGMYFLQFKTENGSVVEKFVKE